MNRAVSGFRYYDADLGRFITRDPSGYPDGTNNYLYCHNNPINFVDPLGLRKDKGGFKVKGKGQHIVPVETWEKFGFADEAKEIFDSATIGENFKTPIDRHNRLGHGSYTDNVTELMGETISDYTKKAGSKGKLTLKQQKELANMIVDKVKHSDNLAIKGFNEAIEKGGRTELSNFLAKHGDDLPIPNAKTLDRIKDGYGVIKGIAHIPSSGFKILKKVPIVKLTVPLSVAAFVYNNARADGESREVAASTALAEAMNPYLVGPDDLREGAKFLWNTAHTAAQPGKDYIESIQKNQRAIQNSDVQADKKSTGSAYDAQAKSANANPERMYIPSYK